jgi:SAM-dependent methyltransferase
MGVIARANEIYLEHGLSDLLVSAFRHSLFLLLRKDRKKKLRRNCKIGSGIGLEIGPLVSPIVTKQEGRVYYVDYYSTEELKEKFSGRTEIDTSRLVPVDFVSRKMSYPEIRSQIKSVDYVIASHVFEHLPDPLGWLRSLAAILSPGGMISLAIPDRRYTFDYYRSETTADQLLLYEYEGLKQPSPLQVRDYLANICSLDTIDAWDRRDPRQKPKRSYIGEVLNRMIESSTGKASADTHCTVWTYESFLRVFPWAMKLANIPLRIESAYPPEKYSNEFIIHLKLTSHTT